MKRFATFGLIFFFSALAAFAQGGSITPTGSVLSRFGTPLAGINVAVCTDQESSYPCSALATLYSTPALSGSPIANPFTTDANGNFNVFASPGNYWLQYWGTGVVSSTTEIAVGGGATPAGATGQVQTNGGGGTLAAINSPAGQWNKIATVMAPVLSAEQNWLQEPTPFVVPTPLVLTNVSGNTPVLGMWYDYGFSSPLTGYAESLDGLHWTKYASNPIVSGHLHIGMALIGGTYYMCAANGVIATGIDMYAGSTPISLSLIGSSVIGLGSGGTWNANNIGNCGLFFDTGAGIYRMYVEASNAAGEWAIGRWSSPNLTGGGTWTPDARNPIISNYPRGVGDPKSIRQISSSLYYMWPWCTSSSAPAGSVLPADGCFFASSDGVTWTQVPNGPVIPRTTADEGVNTATGVVADLAPVDFAGKCYMFYTAAPNENSNATGSFVKLAIGKQPCNTMGAAAAQQTTEPGQAQGLPVIAIGSGTGAGIVPQGVQESICGSTKANSAPCGFFEHFSANAGADQFLIGNNISYSLGAYSPWSSSYTTTFCLFAAANLNANSSLACFGHTTTGVLKEYFQAGMDSSGNPYFELPGYPVGMLPSASGVGANAIVIVTDCTSYTPGALCTGGGSDYMIGVSNGTAWTVH